ncbi:hypothetical protein ABIB81_000823 [Bradyrhizobium sp. I1.7.5]
MNEARMSSIGSNSERGGAVLCGAAAAPSPRD